MTSDDARDAIMALLAARAEGVTVCPSEAARLVAAGNSRAAPDAWREAMPLVHAAVDRLHAQHLVRLSWKGQVLPARTGPYRIGRGHAR